MDEAMLKWVLAVHAGTPPPSAEEVDAGIMVSKPEAEAGTGLWWGVLNAEGDGFEPESLWRDKADAEARAEQLNSNSAYPSWAPMPAALVWWMRNEIPPETTC